MSQIYEVSKPSASARPIPMSLFVSLYLAKTKHLNMEFEKTVRRSSGDLSPRGADLYKSASSCQLTVSSFFNHKNFKFHSFIPFLTCPLILSIHLNKDTIHLSRNCFRVCQVITKNFIIAVYRVLQSTKRNLATKFFVDCYFIEVVLIHFFARR